jgi:uncharacterized membrane protein YeaQ/YmgE (transglycosylase-associated protein family)
MSSIVVDLIILLIAGVIGGNMVGKSLSDYDLGGVGNTIAGGIGGVVGGQILQAVILILVGGDVGSIVAPLVGGVASGAILTAVVAVLKRRMASK